MSRVITGIHLKLCAGYYLQHVLLGNVRTVDGQLRHGGPREHFSSKRVFYVPSRVNPGDAVGPKSWSSRYISNSIRKNALKCRPITSLEVKQLNE